MSDGQSRLGLERFPSREECVLADILAARAASTPEKTFVLFPDGEWSYEETASRAWQMANALIGLGVKPGDHVSAWMPSGQALLQTWFGTNAAGATYAPINPAARGSLLAHLLNLAGSRLLVAHPRLAERLVGLELPKLEAVILTGELASGVRLPWPTLMLDDLLAEAGTRRPDLSPPTEPWDDIVLIYTSGTTGPSKGVRLSYANHLLSECYLVWPDVGADDRFLLALPLFHTAGTVTTYAMLARGGSMALVERFDPKTYWQDVRRLGATTTVIIHSMVSFLLAQPAAADDADNPLRVCYMGPLTQVEEFCRRFGLSVFTGFGMTEVPLAIRSGLNPSNERACGRLMDSEQFEMRLVDEHDLPVPAGTPGELIVRHSLPWVINSGYKDMPEATADAWRNGWFHSGDRMVCDEDGEFYFLDRAKDAIRRRGENISSFEVEAEVLAHPAVAEAAAVSVPSPGSARTTGDQEVKIVIVLRDGESISETELIEFLIPRMPHYMVPRFVEVAPALPRTPSFKVKKAELRDAGVTAATWDREAADIVLKGERLV